MNQENTATMNHHLSRIALITLFIAPVLYIWFCSPATTFATFFPFQTQLCRPLPISDVVPKDELEIALNKAAIPENKTLFIAVVNKAYVEAEYMNITMLDIFLDSFWLGEGTRPLLDHLLVVAVDQTAYDRCIFRRLHCYRLATDAVDFAGEKLYMSEDFIKMMWTRTLFLLDVLKRGYNFIFTDTDVMWLRNPFTRLTMDPNEDLQISTDLFNGQPWSEENFINTGFYFIRSNNKTIALFEKWYGMNKNSTGMKEQDVLASLKEQGVFRQLGLKVRFLDTQYFSGFCSDSKDVRAVATVHANCCRSIRAKTIDLVAVLWDWKQFTKTIPHDKRGKEVDNSTISDNSNVNYAMEFRWSKHDACNNSWREPEKFQ